MEDNFAQSRNMRGGCGLVAISNVTGIPLETVFNDYKRIFKKAGRWNGRTTERNCLKLYKKYGVKLLPLKCDRVTLRSFIDDAGHISNANTLIVRTTGHIQIVRHGKVTDQGGTKTINEFWGKNKIVKSAWRVVGVKQYVPPLIEIKPKREKIKRDLKTERYMKAQAMLKKWSTKEKVAIAKRKKYAQQVKRYEKKITELSNQPITWGQS